MTGSMVLPTTARNAQLPHCVHLNEVSGTRPRGRPGGTNHPHGLGTHQHQCRATHPERYVASAQDLGTA